MNHRLYREKYSKHIEFALALEMEPLPTASNEQYQNLEQQQTEYQQQQAAANNNRPNTNQHQQQSTSLRYPYTSFQAQTSQCHHHEPSSQPSPVHYSPVIHYGGNAASQTSININNDNNDFGINEDRVAALTTGSCHYNNSFEPRDAMATNGKGGGYYMANHHQDHSSYLQMYQQQHHGSSSWPMASSQQESNGSCQQQQYLYNNFTCYQDSSHYHNQQEQHNSVSLQTTQDISCQGTKTDYYQRPGNYPIIEQYQDNHQRASYHQEIDDTCPYKQPQVFATATDSQQIIINHIDNNNNHDSSNPLNNPVNQSEALQTEPRSYHINDSSSLVQSVIVNGASNNLEQQTASAWTVQLTSGDVTRESVANKETNSHSGTARAGTNTQIEGGIQMLSTIDREPTDFSTKYFKSISQVPSVVQQPQYRVQDSYGRRQQMKFKDMLMKSELVVMRPDRGSRPMGSSSNQKANQCLVCKRNYARPSTLKTHLRTHTNERPYKCTVCLKTFSQAANLTAHQRVHTGERPFSCPTCGRQFSQSSSVITHLRTHSGERPYRCRLCSRTFSDSSTLTKHCRIHSGEKPYRCDHCPLNFSQSGNLSRHLKLHLLSSNNSTSSSSSASSSSSSTSSLASNGPPFSVNLLNQSYT